MQPAPVLFWLFVKHSRHDLLFMTLRGGAVISVDGQCFQVEAGVISAAEQHGRASAGSSAPKAVGV